MAVANLGQLTERSVNHDARILVVDDKSDIANLLGTVLREEGFSVRVVTDSRQALEVFNSFRPDLVSIDVMMPSVDGISLCLQLRKESDVPILFVSAKSDPPDRVVGLRIGADGLISEVHPDPERALSDGPQSLIFDQFATLMRGLEALRPGPISSPAAVPAASR